MLRGQLEEAAGQLYGGLEPALADPGQREVLIAMLEGAACIWAGSGFVPGDAAVLGSDFDFAPHIHVVPAAVAGRHQELLKFLGVSLRMKLNNWHHICYLFPQAQDACSEGSLHRPGVAALRCQSADDQCVLAACSPGSSLCRSRGR